MRNFVFGWFRVEEKVEDAALVAVLPNPNGAISSLKSRVPKNTSQP